MVRALALPFGSTCAFHQDMMLHRSEQQDPARRQNCTIEQARQLLEELRAGYRTLSTSDRDYIKHTISAVERARVTTARDEGKQCFESAL